MHTTPADYENKFADFIHVLAEAKASGKTTVAIAYPWVIGDNYDEIIESLSRLADAGLTLDIAARKYWPSLN
jgi:hypothetical protein